MMREELVLLSQLMHLWLLNIILLLFSIFKHILIKMILLPLVRIEAIAQSSYSSLPSFIRHFNKILGLFIPLIVFSSLLPFSRFTPATLTVVSKIVEILLIASFAILLVRTVRMFEDYLYHRFDVNKENNLRERKIRTQ